MRPVLPVDEIITYLKACDASRDHRRFGHMAWAGPNVTHRDVETWIRMLFHGCAWPFPPNAARSEFCVGVGVVQMLDGVWEAMDRDVTVMGVGDTPIAAWCAAEEAAKALGYRGIVPQTKRDEQLLKGE